MIDPATLAAGQPTGKETGKATSAKPSDAESLSQTYDQFLIMLTTQMQNQDPLNPMDSAKFTEQLVSYSSVEQQIKSNEKLDQLLNLTGGNAITDAVGMIGKEVQAAGDQVTLDETGASFGYSLSSGADQVEIQIKDASGQVVRRLSGETAAGQHKVAWDGLGDGGAEMPEGAYSVGVNALRGEEVSAAPTLTFRRVTGVESGAEGVILELAGGELAPLSEIDAIREPKG